MVSLLNLELSRRCSLARTCRYREAKTLAARSRICRFVIQRLKLAALLPTLPFGPMLRRRQTVALERSLERIWSQLVRTRQRSQEGVVSCMPISELMEVVYPALRRRRRG